MYYDAKIHYLAVGIVIEEQAKPIIDLWLSLNGKQPIPMLGASNTVKNFISQIMM